MGKDSAPLFGMEREPCRVSNALKSDVGGSPLHSRQDVFLGNLLAFGQQDVRGHKTKSFDIRIQNDGKKPSS